MSVIPLFVYGTLQPGKPNAYLLERIGGTWRKASVRGYFHDEGWGATMGYPAVKLDPNGELVSGYVFSSEKLSQHWEELDEFEGDAYERLQTQVTLHEEKQITAFIYALRAR